MTGLNLPKKCGVMLLPDCTLFPHGGLPLYIFEQRYRDMLDDALAGDCVFAVGRVREGDDGKEEIAEIGTAGLVRASRLGGDGTSQLLLHGVIRVRFCEWLDEGKAYPLALIEPVIPEPLEGKRGEAAMKTLRGAVEDGISGLPGDVQAGVLALLDQADEPGLMADLVAQQFVHEPDLRQELLETAAVGDRVRMLCGFFANLRTDA
ncbi:LON peptidase substrate-binding domain-containing protein [Akkermansiaceae bacterium]|nr:LON peptidase substrate-binding domain-containing protein [Akkermansiaceae bacterium]